MTVPVDGCSLPFQLFAGEATVTEVERTGADFVGVGGHSS